MTELGELYASGPPYDEEQRAGIAAAIVEAADLLGQGFVVDELGRVVMEQQPEDPDEAAEEAERAEAREAWLNTKILPPEDGNGQTALNLKNVTRLHKRGIKTYRDLLIVGCDKTSDIFYNPRLEFRGLRHHPITGELRKMLDNSNPDGVTWEGRPSIEQIAALSKDLSEVPAYVLMFREDLVGRTIPYSKHDNWQSVQEMLEALRKPPKSRKELTKAHQYSGRGMEVAQSAALEFARKYEEAKAHAP